MHEQLAKKPGCGLWDHIRHVKWVLARYLEDVLNGCLRIENNWVIFLLLTRKGALSGAIELTSCTPWLVITARGGSIVGVIRNLWG